MKDSEKSYSHDPNTKKWSGIASQTKSIIRGISTPDRNFENNFKIQADIETMLFKAVSETLNQYTRPKVKGSIENKKILEGNQEYLSLIESKRDDIYRVIESNLLTYLEGKELATPFGQLVVYSDSFTKELLKILRGNKNLEVKSLSSSKIQEVLSGMNGSSKFSKNLFEKLKKSMGSKLLLEFSICKDLGVSVTKLIKDDEFLGCIAQIISETFPLIIHSIFDLKKLGYNDDQQLEFIKTLIVYLEIDIFARKHQELVGLIRDAARRQTLEQPF